MSVAMYGFPEFGMYRVLEPDAAGAVGWLAEAARGHVAEYFWRHGIASSVEVPPDFGITFVCRRGVKDRAQQLDEDGFDFAGFRDDLGHDLWPNAPRREAIGIAPATVVIGRRSLGIGLDTCHPGHRRLIDQKHAILEAAARHGGRALLSRTGSHITILKWPAEHMAQGEYKTRFTSERRQKVRDYIAMLSLQHGLRELGLCSMIIGMGYQEPWTLPLPRRQASVLALAP